MTGLAGHILFRVGRLVASGRVVESLAKGRRVAGGALDVPAEGQPVPVERVARRGRDLRVQGEPVGRRLSDPPPGDGQDLASSVRPPHEHLLERRIAVDHTLTLYSDKISNINLLSC